MNPSSRSWAIKTYLFRGWQTWEDHAALPTNGLARESEHQRGLVLGFNNAKFKLGSSEPETRTRRGKHERQEREEKEEKRRQAAGQQKKADQPQAGAQNGEDTKSRQNNKDRRQTKAIENRLVLLSGFDPACYCRTKRKSKRTQQSILVYIYI